MVVGFVPREDVEPLAVHPRCRGIGLGGEIGFGEREQVGEHVSPAFFEVPHDLRQRGHVGIRGASASVAFDEVGLGRFAALHANVEVPIVGGGDVHQLPADVSAPRSGLPSQSGGCVRECRDRVEEPARFRADEFE